VEEKEFDYWLDPETDKKYTAAINTLAMTGSIDFKVLVKEGDTNLSASNYVTYKFLPRDSFSNVPFYVYGSKLAFILFGESATVHVIDNADVANAQRAQFNFTWQNAIEV